MNVTKEKEILTNKSRVAVLGTLADLHQEPIRFNLKTLRRLVKELKPDLLCAEIHPNDWQRSDWDRMMPEYKEALVSLSRRSDIIIVPVSSSNERELIAPWDQRWYRLRSWIVRLLNGQLRFMQRVANGPRAINSGVFSWLCDGTCSLTAWVCGPEARQAWDKNNEVILNNILAAVQRDPGRRVLVTVDCRRRHRLEKQLRRAPGIDLVFYQHL